MQEEDSIVPEPVPAQLPAWRTVLGGLSLTCGMLSCVIFIGTYVLGIAALLLAVLSRAGLPKSERRVRGTGLARAGTFFGSIGIAISVPVTLMGFAMSNVSSYHHDEVCRYHLQCIYTALEMYAGEHNGAVPDRLSALYPDYTSDLSTFVCPASGNEPGDGGRIDEWSEYTYVPGLRPSGTPADAKVLLCYERAPRHIPPGRNELYLDGHIEYRSPEGPQSTQQP